MNIKAPFFKIESFGAVDGPGIRLVVFLQGCPLRCIYCHNPESWNETSQFEISPKEIIDKFKKNQKFYRNGGITLSGGEPLIHQQFCFELAKLCFVERISLAFDTSGITFNSKNLNFYKQVIKYRPLWLIDIKHINPEKHKIITGTKKQNELLLIKFLEKNKQPYWIRQVLIPQYTDAHRDLKTLNKFLKDLKYLQNFQLLPYHRLALTKYKVLRLQNKIANIPEPTKRMIHDAKQIIINGK
ncbi:MAG: pyruvate formate lyase-activating protein [Mycoplasmataceae bacterium]|jgi:pyruvate formate lyase activating enzyme|nr:pyruvate formate lyase-activating protein [Mycoplasmataceae bacterium]